MRTLVKSITVAAFAGALGFAGNASAKPWDHERPIQPTREGVAPPGVIRGDVNLRVSHDGRGETSVDRTRERAIFSPQRQRPDTNLGQGSHFAPPVKSEVSIRLEGVNEGIDKPAKNQRAFTTQQNTFNKGLPGRHEHPAPALPIKTSVMMQVTGGEAGMGQGATDGGSDDPKLARQSDNSQDKNLSNRAHRDTRVYPGRHEHIPSPVEASMWVQTRQSAQGDNAGDKDAP
jgi:hypothetical protein